MSFHQPQRTRGRHRLWYPCARALDHLHSQPGTAPADPVRSGSSGPRLVYSRETMRSSHDFLSALATVLCVAAVTTVVFHRLRQPVVLGYLLTGLIIGPHVPVPLVADSEVV